MNSATSTSRRGRKVAVGGSGAWGRAHSSTTSSSQSLGRRQQGRHANYDRTGNAYQPNKRPEKLRVFTSQFDSWHSSIQAARYKVHKPNCNCPTLERVRYHNMEFVEQQQQQEIMEEDEAKKIAWNALTVQPQVKNIRSMYRCLDTEQEVYSANPVQAELKLRREIFDNNKTDEATADYGVSCAPCLLHREPNGFACVSSNSVESLNQVRDTARLAALQKQELHPDHAHHLVTVPHSALARLWRSSKKGGHDNGKGRDDELYDLLCTQDVPIEPETSAIVLGYHLTSLLGLTTTNKKSNTNTSRAADPCWLVMVYDGTGKQHSRPHWTLDLPGGKRHLGETALDAAIRETLEETSLVWTADWVQEQLQSDRKEQSINRYYLLTPPSCLAN